MDQLTTTQILEHYCEIKKNQQQIIALLTSIASLPEHDYGKNILDVQKQSPVLVDDKLPNVAPVNTVKESLIINGMLPRYCW